MYSCKTKYFLRDSTLPSAKYLASAASPKVFSTPKRLGKEDKALHEAVNKEADHDGHESQHKSKSIQIYIALTFQLKESSCLIYLLPSCCTSSLFMTLHVNLVATLNANSLKKREPQDGVFRQVQVPFHVIRHSPMLRKARTFGNTRNFENSNKGSKHISSGNNTITPVSFQEQKELYGGTFFINMSTELTIRCIYVVTELSPSL